jgi:hypothetical protein
MSLPSGREQSPLNEGAAQQGPATDGARSHPTDVRPFRIAWSLGDNRLHPRDPLHFLITAA